MSSRRNPRGGRCHVSVIRNIKKGKKGDKSLLWDADDFQRVRQFRAVLRPSAAQHAVKDIGVSRSFKGYCNSPAYAVCVRVCACVYACVCVEASACPPPCPCPPPCIFTCSSCCWICCSWKRQLAHQTPLPGRNRSVSLPRSRPGERQNKHTCVKRQTKGTGEEKSHY